MATVTDLNDRRPHIAVWMRCSDCFHKFLSVRPAQVVRRWWECPKCHEIAAKEIDHE